MPYQDPHSSSFQNLHDNKAHYDALNLPTIATKKEVKEQYKKLALERHADRLPKKDKETEDSFEKRKAEANAAFINNEPSLSRVNEASVKFQNHK